MDQLITTLNLLFLGQGNQHEDPEDLQGSGEG